MAVKPIREGFHAITPYLVVNGVPKLLEFLRRTFDARITEQVARPDGGIMHAEARIGDSIVMMGEPMCDATPMPASLYVYVKDTDAVYRRALNAGATSVTEPADQFYGDRMATVVDPSGNRWSIATHIEDVSQEEVRQRAQALMQRRGAA